MTREAARAETDMAEPIIGQTTGGGTAEVVKDGTTASFAADVLDASREVPVIVDLWAPWCGPCRQLGPMLEKVVRAARGRVRLVKINVDEEQPIVQALGQQLRLPVQSIPAVFAFRNGQPVDGFVGALPESQIRQFVERLLGGAGPSQIEQVLEMARQALEQNNPAAAAQAFAAVLQEEPGNPAALGGLAKCYLANDDLARARQTLGLVPPEGREHPEVKSAEAAIALRERAQDVGEIDELRARIAADPNDLQARHDLALALLGAGRREEAVDELLEIVRRDREWNEQAARKQLLQLFEAFGPSDPLTTSARRRLSSILFS